MAKGQHSAAGYSSATDARRILAFASSVPAEVDTLIVQCWGGKSRSPAVALALRALRGEERPDHLDNRHIFETILRVAGERDGEYEKLRR